MSSLAWSISRSRDRWVNLNEIFIIINGSNRRIVIAHGRADPPSRITICFHTKIHRREEWFQIRIHLPGLLRSSETSLDREPLYLSIHLRPTGISLYDRRVGAEAQEGKLDHPDLLVPRSTGDEEHGHPISPHFVFLRSHGRSTAQLHLRQDVFSVWVRGNHLSSLISLVIRTVNRWSTPCWRKPVFHCSRC